MRVVLFATSEFAVPTMRLLAQDPAFVLPAIVTQPDARAGRGRQVSSSPIRKAAEELGVAVHQPQDINGPESVAFLRELQADVFLTAAYGQKLSDEVLRLPARHALNLHGSLLPRHRGASPAQHAILCGDARSGVTLVEMTDRMDAGPVIARKETPIGPTESSGELLERLADLARDLFQEQAAALRNGTARGLPQDESQATRAPLLRKEDGRVIWDRTAAQIDRHVRGMTPWPGAFTFCPTDRSPVRLLVVTGEILDLPSPAMPGTVVAFTSGIEVATRAGVYRVLEVKRSGKRALSAVEFLRGFPLPVGTRMM